MKMDINDQGAAPLNIPQGLIAVITDTDRQENAKHPGNIRLLTKNGLFRVYFYKSADGMFWAAAYQKYSKKACFRYGFYEAKARYDYMKVWVYERVIKEFRV